MKTKLITLAIFVVLVANQVFAQDKTTVNATSSEISDNLDLRAVASIFGDSEDLSDFERRLNDPKLQISNLDLNNDNAVDYLRVIESIEGNTHLIIVQAVLDKDVFQDVATVEVEKDAHNKVQIQVVGDVYMYGNNYIYEPVYVHTPVIYTSFWGNQYRPYYSSWYWNYYPTYYYAWNPYPVFRYRKNIVRCFNVNHSYNYVNVRRSHTAIALYNSRRSNGYELQHPQRSFVVRNNNVSNRYELDRTRTVTNTGVRHGSPRAMSRGNNSRLEVSSIRGNHSATTNPSRRSSTLTPLNSRGNNRSNIASSRENRKESNSSRERTSNRSESSRGNRQSIGR
jgi:hypothetical protein